MSEVAEADATVLEQLEQTREELEQARRELRELNKIGMALMSERDPERLLGIILTQACALTGSDAGSLYLVEEGKVEARSSTSCAHRTLRFPTSALTISSCHSTTRAWPGTPR